MRALFKVLTGIRGYWYLIFCFVRKHKCFEKQIKFQNVRNSRVFIINSDIVYYVWRFLTLIQNRVSRPIYRYQAQLFVRCWEDDNHISKYWNRFLFLKYNHWEWSPVPIPIIICQVQQMVVIIYQNLKLYIILKQILLL